MRKFLLAVILLLGIVFIIGRFAEVQKIVETLQRGDWRFLLLALVFQGLWLLNVGASYREIYKAIGLEEDARHLLLMATAANFLNIVAPSVGMSGMAVFISEARRRNNPVGRVAIAGVLYLLLDYIAFLCILALGLFVLFRRNNLNTGELVAGGLLFALSIVLAILIYLGTRSALLLGRALAWMARLVNAVLRPFLKREYLSEERAYTFAHDASEGLKEITQEPKKVIVPALLALSQQILLIGVLYLSFKAFQVPVSTGTLIAGFSIGYLFMIVSPTPSGLGIVEGMLTLALSSMYIPFSAAAVITLAYRGFTFWVPLLFGFFAVRLLGGTKDITAVV